MLQSPTTKWSVLKINANKRLFYKQIPSYLHNWFLFCTVTAIPKLQIPFKLPAHFLFCKNKFISSRLSGFYIFYIIDQVLPHTLPTIQDEFRIFIVCFIIPSILITFIIQSIKYWNHLKWKKNQKVFWYRKVVDSD